MILLVCGGRDYKNLERVLEVLEPIKKEIDILIHGGAKGADTACEVVAHSLGVHTAKVDALWDYFRLAAGPKRNRAMLKLRPDKLIAFPGGKGTADMINAAREAGIEVEIIGGTLQGSGDNR